MVDVTELSGHWQSKLGSYGAVVQGLEALHESVRLIVSTQKESVPGKLDYGVDWLAAIDKPMNVAAPIVVNDCLAALTRYETRIKVTSVEPVLGEELGRLFARVRWQPKTGGPSQVTEVTP